MTTRINTTRITRITLIVLIYLSGWVFHSQVYGQIDSTLLKGTRGDSVVRRGMNMDAVYSRPFLQVGKTPVSVGGYVEAHYEYMGTDGVTEGHSFAIPRMTLFVASSI